jgi:hypothetical protein
VRCRYSAAALSDALPTIHAPSQSRGISAGVSLRFRDDTESNTSTQVALDGTLNGSCGVQEGAGTLAGEALSYVRSSWRAGLERNQATSGRRRGRLLDSSAAMVQSRPVADTTQENRAAGL